MTLDLPCRPYWGKARPQEPIGAVPGGAEPNSAESSAPAWHPFAYHSLDVAAVASALWANASGVRRALCTAFGVTEPAAQAQLRAWILFFIALHDLGKLHLLFQRQAPPIMALGWPTLTATDVFPAPAGMNLFFVLWLSNRHRVPRACGDEPPPTPIDPSTR